MTIRIISRVMVGISRIIVKPINRRTIRRMVYTATPAASRSPFSSELVRRSRSHIIPILLRHFIISLQHQQRYHTVVDIIRREPVCDRECTDRVSWKRRTEMLPTLLASRVRPCGVRDHRIERIERRKETRKENELDWRENKGVQMSGRPAWPQQNVQPTLLPSSGSYRAIYRYGAKPTRSTEERSARLRHVGREAARDESAGQRGCIYARIRERTARRRWRPPRPWIKHLSTAVQSVSGTGLYSAVTRREVHRSPCLRYHAGLVCRWVCRTGKSILFSRSPFFSYRLISFI